MRLDAPCLALILAAVLVSPAAGGEALDCPQQTKAHEDRTSWSRELWCELSDSHGSRRHGPYRLETLEGQVLIEGSYSQGSQAGSWRVFSGSGQLQSVMNFEDGRKHGVLRRYHANGTIALEEHYEQGVLDGPFASWHANGQLKQRGSYDRGAETGDWTRWNDDGLRIEEGRAEAGSRVGVWRRYGPDGSLVSTTDHDRSSTAARPSDRPAGDSIREDEVIGVEVLLPPHAPTADGNASSEPAESGKP